MAVSQAMALPTLAVRSVSSPVSSRASAEALPPPQAPKSRCPPLGLKAVQLLPLHALALVDADEDLAVDLRPRDPLQDRGPIVRRRLEERGEAALGQQHGAGETVEIYASGRIDPFGHPSDVGLEVRAGVGVGDLVFRGLKLSVWPLACPALASVAPVLHGLGFEGHFGAALPGPVGQDLVPALDDLGQTRPPPVEGKANGVEDRGLPRFGGAGDGEDPVRGEVGVRQVDLPFPGQRFQILETDLQNFHRLPRHQVVPVEVGDGLPVGPEQLRPLRPGHAMGREAPLEHVLCVQVVERLRQTVWKGPELGPAQVLVGGEEQFKWWQFLIHWAFPSFCEDSSSAPAPIQSLAILSQSIGQASLLVQTFQKSGSSDSGL